jgi:hypothetical protein
MAQPVIQDSIICPQNKHYVKPSLRKEVTAMIVNYLASLSHFVLHLIYELQHRNIVPWPQSYVQSNSSLQLNMMCSSKPDCVEPIHHRLSTNNAVENIWASDKLNTKESGKINTYGISVEY